MKLAIYDPLKAFTPFLEHIGKSHEVTWIDIPVALDELRWQHIHNDVVWYEFTDEVFARATQMPKECKIVNRLHSYELFTDIFNKVNWDNADILCASSDYVKDLLEAKRRDIDFPPIVALANGPNLNSMTIPDGKVYNKKIAVVGRINYKKNLPLAIYCLDAVRDLGYEMHFIGGSQDRRFDFYLKHLVTTLGLQGQAFFHGEIPYRDVPEALSDMGYILSSSLFESFGQSIMEGIAMGCLPIIHDFPGSKGRFSEMGDIFFLTPNEFVRVMDTHDKLSLDEKNQRALHNREVIAKCDLNTQNKILDKVLADLEEDLDYSK